MLTCGGLQEPSRGSGCLDRISLVISDEPKVDRSSIGVLAVPLRAQRGEPMIRIPHKPRLSMAPTGGRSGGREPLR